MKKIYLVLIILFILVVIGGTIIFWKSKNNDVEEEKKESEKIEEKINDEKEKQNQLVTRLIEEQIIPYEKSIFQQSEEKNKYGYMFSNIKIDYSNISNVLKFAMVYNELLRSGYDDVKYYRFKYDEFDDRYGDINNWEEIDNSEDYGEITKVYYKITKDNVHEMARQMFGEDILIDGDYRPNYVVQCSFRNDEYFCRENIGGGTGVYEYVTELDHYELEDENLVIYQKAYWIEKDWETNKYNIAPSIDSKSLAQLDDIFYEFEENLYQKYGRIYKSIFKKNSNGNYYWVSSEPVIKN